MPGFGTDTAALTPDAQRLRQFIAQNEWGGPVGVGLVGLVWYLSPTFTPVFPLLIGGCLLNWGLVRWARRLCVQDRLREAVLAIASGMWFISLTLAVGAPSIYPLTVIVTLMPVAISVWLAGTYLGRPMLVTVSAISTAVAAVGAVFTWFDPLYPFAPEVQPLIQVVISSVAAILVLSTALTFTFASQRVVEMMNDLRATNEALEESERGLERKVHERTEQLEESRRHLAEARDDALQASRAKSDFLANMSHELRTPLNAIIGYGEMLQEEARDDGQDDYLPDLDRIVSSGRYLLTLINGVLDLSKIEAGKMDVYVETFDVDDMLQGVEGTIRPLIQKNENTIEVIGAGSLGRMRSDVTKIRQVLFNLLSNASKFTHAGTVKLVAERRTSEDGDWLHFRVTDTGIGMTSEQLEKVFEAFSQAEASTTREYGGTGLGLAITREFCEMLGGSIDAESQPGVGSSFEARLPAEAAESEMNDAHDAEAARGAAGTATEVTVLVVDDDASARDLLTRFLTRAGFGVVTATNGEQALRIARERAPDVITLDVIMPEMDGWEVLRAIKADPALAGTPVILLTVTDDQNLGYALGAAEYLTKPIDWERLAGVLSKYRAGPSAAALVIDDDPLARDMARRGLERAGWSVVEAENGRVGLARVEAEAPAVILLDLMMPEMDGFEFVQLLREREAWRGIPIVVVTAKDLTQEDRVRLDGSVHRIFQKGSFTREDLLDEIRRLAGTPPAGTGAEGGD